MNITVHLDARAWYAAMDELEFAVLEAMRKSAVEGAEAIQGVTRGLLTAKGHAEFTKTPSAKGSPPAAISGALAASVHVTALPQELGAMVGPTSEASSVNGPYGRAQELGSDDEAIRAKYMRWVENGKTYYKKARELPERPYLKPATEDVIASGELHDIYVRNVEIAIASVTG